MDSRAQSLDSDALDSGSDHLSDCVTLCKLPNLSVHLQKGRDDNNSTICKGVVVTVKAVRGGWCRLIRVGYYYFIVLNVHSLHQKPVVESYL